MYESVTAALADLDAIQRSLDATTDEIASELKEALRG
jgi:hypothetical protein